MASPEGRVGRLAIAASAKNSSKGGPPGFVFLPLPLPSPSGSKGMFFSAASAIRQGLSQTAYGTHGGKTAASPPTEAEGSYRVRLVK